MVAGNDDAAAVEDRIFAEVFFVYPQHVWRGCGVCLHVIVKGETAEFAEIAGLVYAQDDGFQEAVEAAEHLEGGCLLKVPGADSVFHGLEEAVLTDALLATQDERM